MPYAHEYLIFRSKGYIFRHDRAGVNRVLTRIEPVFTLTLTQSSKHFGTDLTRVRLAGAAEPRTLLCTRKSGLT